MKKILKYFYFIGVLQFSLFSFSAYGYRLAKIPFFQSCPFLHQDQYAAELNRFIDIIDNQLQTKIGENQRCNSAFANISQEFNAIELIFKNNINPSLFEDIQDEILSRKLQKLRLDLLSKKSKNTEFQLLKEKIQELEVELKDIEISKLYSREIYKQERDNQVLQNVFNHLNNAVITMTTLPPDCVEQVGGWQHILPVALNTVSSLSGLSGYSYGPMIGASTKLIASLVTLLQDVNAKRALRDLIHHKNDKILACTYFSIKKSACEYKNALELSEDFKAIEDAINNRYKNKKTAHYDEFLRLASLKNDFANIFAQIATMGSAITLDVELIARYFIALRAKPNTILNEDDIGQPPLDSDETEEANNLRQLWLIKVRTRGINFITKTNFGQNSLKEQVKQALVDIDNKRSDIASVESILSGTRSFVDLKHEIDTQAPIKLKVKRYINYFERLLQGEIVDGISKGLVFAALEILKELQTFFSISYNQFSLESFNNSTTPLEEYTNAINSQGRKLFKVMSEGAVAQVTRQTVLSIGGTVQERIKRVFKMIEAIFIREDVINKDNPNHVRFTSYQIDRSILSYVIENYQAFSGSGRTFRAEDVAIALKTLDQGFGKEIRRVVKNSLKTKSELYPSLEGETASHLCVLFSNSLNRSGILNNKYRKKLKACKKRFNKLGLIKIIKPESIKIDWNDQCFYPEYIELYQSEQAILQQMLSLGHKI